MPATTNSTTTVRRRRLLVVLGAVYVAALVLVVMLPISGLLLGATVDAGRGWSASGLPGPTTVPWTGAALNVVLFVPLGVLLVGLGGRRWYAAAGIAVLVSVGAEVVQLLPLLHRDPTLVDVLANGLGGLLGAVAATVLRPRRRRSPVRIPQQRRGSLPGRQPARR